MRRPRHIIDIAIAVAVFLVGIPPVPSGDAGEPVAVFVLLTALIALPLAWRREVPLPVVAVVSAASAVAAIIAPDPESGQIAIPIALLIAVFTAGRELEPRAAVIGFAVVVPPQWVGQLVVDAPASELVFTTGIFGTLWASGQILRRRAGQVVAERERADRAERDREVAERAAVVAERTRIARELHDVVSHSLSVIVLQAQAVRHRLREDQSREAQDLRGVETTARDALAEMRRLFGVLRAEGEVASLAPQPGLDQLDELLAASRDAGVPVDLEIRGKRIPLPPGLDLAAYRIVQEALTNVRRHADASRTAVRLSFRESGLDVEVCDDGRGGEALAGNGLIGMRERVTLYGGTLDAGPAGNGGGFRVQAHLPLADHA